LQVTPARSFWTFWALWAVGWPRAGKEERGKECCHTSGKSAAAAAAAVRAAAAMASKRAAAAATAAAATARAAIAHIAQLGGLQCQFSNQESSCSGFHTFPPLSGNASRVTREGGARVHVRTHAPT